MGANHCAHSSGKRHWPTKLASKSLLYTTASPLSAVPPAGNLPDCWSGKWQRPARRAPNVDNSWLPIVACPGRGSRSRALLLHCTCLESGLATLTVGPCLPLLPGESRCKGRRCQWWGWVGGSVFTFVCTRLACASGSDDVHDH